MATTHSLSYLPDSRGETESRSDSTTAVMKLHIAIHADTVLQKRGHALFKVEATTYDITYTDRESVRVFLIKGGGA